jgi:hypothetical protein
MLTSPYSDYLLCKRSVDDRALNRHVLERLRQELARPRRGPLRVLEVGGGLGTMVARLVDWRVITQADYHLLDVDEELIADARVWLASWAKSRGLACTVESASVRLQGEPDIDVTVRLVCAEIGDFLRASANPDLPRADLLVANAFLDLVDVPAILPRLLGLLAEGGLGWFTVNFDGETILEPEHSDDALFMRVYHRSMDERVRHDRAAGDSRSGRHLFAHLRRAGASLLAAGASDWVVHAQPSGYPDGEARFLGRIVDTITAELDQHPDIPPARLAEWAKHRRQQIDSGELVYIAHQLDFLGRAAQDLR